MDESAPEISLTTAFGSNPWQQKDGVEQQAFYFGDHQSFENLFKTIFLRNQLCILGPEVTSAWTSRKLWVNYDGSPNLEYLEENFGEAAAPVADCNAQEFSAHPKQEMKVKDFIAHWKSLKSQGHPEDAKSLYLKDWHFTRSFPSYKAYSPPAFLCYDWMNEFWDVRKDEVKLDDYRFVYMGPKKSWTPFHADVLRSYSWSANICGQKKWIFYPPGVEEKLKDRHGQLIFDLQSPDLNDVTMYPEASSALDNAITVIQNPGEIIFVPTGWHHQVFNLEDTISINHNWINGCSAHITWSFMKNRLAAVQREISDCKGMEGWNEQCQIILKADSGIDYVDFYNFIATIALHRIKALRQLIAETFNPETRDGSQTIHTFKDVAVLYTKHKHGNNLLDIEDEIVGSEEQFQIHSCFKHSETISLGTHLDECKVQSQIFSGLDFEEGSRTRRQIEAQQSEKNIGKESSSVGVGTESSCVPVCLSSCCDDYSVPFLCLFKGIVFYAKSNSGDDRSNKSKNEVKGGEKQKYETDIKGNPHSTTELPSDFQSDSKVGHQKDHDLCPHWAHCGPNLALFDISRVLDIMEDMQGQQEFKAIMENEAILSRFCVPPLELKIQIENTISRMKSRQFY